MNEIFLWLITLVLLLFGVLGTVIPAFPGITLVFIGILFYAWMTEFATISVTFLVVVGIISLLAIGADYAGSALGARFGGGKWKSVLGGVLGLIIGAFVLGPLGLFFGALCGAFLGALVEGATHRDALKTGFFTVLGVVGSTVVQLFLAISLVVAFLLALIF